MSKNKEKCPKWAWVIIVILVALLVYSWTETNKLKEDYKNNSDSNSYDPSDPLPWPFYNYPENKLNVYTQLRNSGYEVKEIQDIYDGEISAIMFDALGSDILQMNDGFWALYVYGGDNEMYKVQIIKEDETCFYKVLASVYTDFIKNPDTDVTLYELYDEGFCIE